MADSTAAPVDQVRNRKDDAYWVPVVAKTIDILECFDSMSRLLTLGQVEEQTGISHTTALRILNTLVAKEYLARIGNWYKRIYDSEAPQC